MTTKTIGKYTVHLNADDRTFLRTLIRQGRPSARTTTRARILLKADEGLSDAAIAAAVHTSVPTIERTRKRFVQDGRDQALYDQPHPGRPRLLDDHHEAQVIATACTAAPEGHLRWTLRLLHERVIDLSIVPTISVETVRQTLHRHQLKPWQRRQWCIPTLSAEYVAAMEDVLDLYAEPYDAQRPVLCFDEKNKPLVADVRPPVPAEPGRPARYDYEYARRGTRNLFVYFDFHLGYRHVDVTERRTKQDYAHCLKWIVDDLYPEATTIRLVQDNLNTHQPRALYETFPPDEARRILSKLEFHFTPKHGSWLNMAEIELSVFERQCLGRRIPDVLTLEREVAALEDERNQQGATVRWRFTTQNARERLKRYYPSLSD